MATPPPHSAHVDRPCWILLALRAADSQTLTPVQLQKSLFLLGKRRARDIGGEFYHFEPYHYGPFDAQVYHDAEWLAQDGAIAINASGDRALRCYSLTEQGRAEAKRVEKHASRRAIAYLGRVVPWSQSLSFNELVRAVYDAYPDMRANSVFRDDDPE